MIGVVKGWQELTADPVRALVPVPRRSMRLHALIIGATGAGKSTLLQHLIADDIRHGHSSIVLDMRGDLVRAATELCAWAVPAMNVFLLDLRETSCSPGFNPLAGGGEIYMRALGLHRVIEEESSSFGVQLSETLRNALLLLASANESVTEIEALLYDRQFLSSCLGRARQCTSSGFWERYLALSPEKQAALAMPVFNKTSLLVATPVTRAVLSHPRPLNLRKHLDLKGSVTLVSLAAEQTHAAGRMLGRVFLASVLREVFARVDVAEHSRNPIRLYVDEFSEFGFDDFEDILAQCRKYRLHLVLAHQTLSQLTPRMRSMVLGNVGVKFVFRTGRDDGAVLSRDLTGDPKALDLTMLATGEAYLWTSGEPPFAIEISEPLVNDTGLLSARAREYVSRIHEGPAYLPVKATPRPACNVHVSPPVRKATANLEDWLS